MQSDKRHRKWASKSRIGAYIRGEIQLEDIMHPSKIIKPRERHNRRSRAFAEACCPTLPPASQPLVVRKDVQSKIRPYIRGLKSLRDLVHPSKLTTRVLGPHHFPAFLQLVQGGPAPAYDSGPESPQPDLQRLLAILGGGSDNQRCVTVLVRDETDDSPDRVVSLILGDAESQSLDSRDRVVSLILSDTESESLADGQDRVVSLILGDTEPHNPEPTRYFYQALAYPTHTSTRRSTDLSPIVITSLPDKPEASETPHVADPPSQVLVTRLYQKIQTLLEERVQTLAYSQRQFEKLETLQKENFQLRTTIAKIGEKLKDIEAGTDTLGSHRNDLTYQEKLKAQNQRLLKTMDTMSSYLGNFESNEDRIRGAAAEDMVDRYKHLYEKEVKNFKRHKRKCEAQHRQLQQRCGQLNQRLQELDSQNLEMAAKLSYVPVKIQLACRQYQDIIKKLNDDLDSLRNLERRSKSSTFAHEKSYPKSYTWF